MYLIRGDLISYKVVNIKIIVDSDRSVEAPKLLINQTIVQVIQFSCFLTKMAAWFFSFSGGGNRMQDMQICRYASRICRKRTFGLSVGGLRGKRKWPHSFLNVAIINAGNDLLSHTLSRAVQSALRGLTSVFGMGTGGTPAVRSPTSVAAVSY